MMTTSFIVIGILYVKIYSQSLRQGLENKLTILVEEVIDHRYYRMETEVIRDFLHLDDIHRPADLIENLSNLEIWVKDKPFRPGAGEDVVYSMKEVKGGLYLALISDTKRIREKTLTMVLYVGALFGLVLLLTSLAFVYFLHRLFTPMECLVRFCKNFSHDRSLLPACGGSSEIAELKEAIMELLEANSRLIEQERDIFKEAAHEIKSPLAVLKARLSLFGSGEYEREEFVREANRDIDRITVHLKELLFLKSIERMLMGSEEAMDIYSELGKITDQFKPLLDKKALQIFYGNKVTFRVMINKKALHKLLKAIGENMITYAEQGSVIFVNINPAKKTVSFVNKIGSKTEREMFSSQIGFKIISHLSEQLKFTFETSEEDEKFTTSLIFTE
jgi:signal transduction histidine kinase